MNAFDNLSEKEIREINGGEGFWFTVGEWAHKAYNKVASWFE